MNNNYCYSISLILSFVYELWDVLIFLISRKKIPVDLIITYYKQLLEKQGFKLGETRISLYWTIDPLIGVNLNFFRQPTLWIIWFICLKFKTYDDYSKKFTKNLLYKIVHLLHGKPKTGVDCILLGLTQMKVYLHINAIIFLKELIKENTIFLTLKPALIKLRAKFIKTFITSYCKYKICYYDINLLNIKKISK